VEPGTSKNFLKDYVRLSLETEIPDIFMFWCGLSTLSCALSRRVWIDMGQYIIYPNLYVVLVAGSGRCRKSTAISIAEKLLRTIEPPVNIIAQKITPEALIETLRVVHTEDEKAFLRETCEGFIVADELSTFLDRKSYEGGLGSLLITLFDCKEFFEYRTRGRGSEMLRSTCLGLLSASTLDWIRNAIPINAVGEGLTSRICFVYVDKAPLPIAMTSTTREKKLLYAGLTRRLQEVSKIQGEVTLDDEARELYIETYNKFYMNSSFYSEPLMSGYASRRHIHLLKLAMLFMVSESDELVLHRRHVTFANNILCQSEDDMQKVVRLIASSDQGILVDLILNQVTRSKRIARTDLLKGLSHRVGTRELSDLIETLVHTGQIQSSVINGKLGYELAE